MIRLLIAPCGCLAAADATSDYPGFARTEEEAASDAASGFKEYAVARPVYRLMGDMGCKHDPKWGLK